MTRRLAARAALFFAFALASSVASATCYVKSDAVGTNTGASWANAYTDLQSALANYPACFDIYVARGTYKPTATTDRTISFNVKPGVFVYGGFAGTEAALGDRNLTINQTILSGDIGAVGDASDNSFHVVVMDGTTVSGTILGSTELSDLTIRDGNANGGAFGAYQDSGGGFLCRGNGAGHECSPTLINLIFENNQALQGGAIYNLGSSSGKASPEITNVILRDNSATYQGGAIYNNGTVSGTSSPLIQGASFSNNSAQNGGAIVNGGAGGTSSPTIRNTTFYANIAQIGGAIANAGQNGGHASPVLRYVTFNKNQATAGAGAAIFNLGNPSGDAAPNISGAIFWGDQATAAPQEMATQSPTTPSIEYSITPECPGGAIGCFNADPLLDPLRDNGGFAPSMRPQVGSPAIEAGNATNCPLLDQRGILRPQGAQCDIGAVELAAAEKKHCYVNGSAGGTNNGLSWATAYLSPNSALADASCTEVWIAQGTYKPTNTTDRTKSFSVPSGKAVYGGFAGTETQRIQRNPATHPTILSGEISSAFKGDNSYHVVVLDATSAAKNITNATVLDGLTITGGNADGANDGRGGGLLCLGRDGYACSPTLANDVFSDNYAVGGGGFALYASDGGGSPAFDSVVFTGNHAGTGGAMYFYADGGWIHPTVSATQFSGNVADTDGGALYYNSGGETNTLVVRGTTFDGNSASSGGAIHIDGASSYADVVFSANYASGSGGAIYDSEIYTSVAFTRAAFFDNHAGQRGGAVYQELSQIVVPRYDHVSFADNSSQHGGAVYTIGGSPTFSDALFLRNGSDGTFEGGAMLIVGDTAGEASPIIDRAAFIGNTAETGGALYTIGGLYGNAHPIVRNTTFAQNLAPNGGGAAYVTASNSHLASTTFQNVTFADNTAYVGGDAIYVTNGSGFASANVSNSILYGNDMQSLGQVFLGAGTVVAIDHSLVTGGCPVGAGCTVVSSNDPLLGILQYYGGFTPALMPAANSPALNAGVSCTTADQRGVTRPQGAACDIGALERRATEDHLFNNGFEF